MALIESKILLLSRAISVRNYFRIQDSDSSLELMPQLIPPEFTEPIDCRELRDFSEIHGRTRGTHSLFLNIDLMIFLSSSAWWESFLSF